MIVILYMCIGSDTLVF